MLDIQSISVSYRRKSVLHQVSLSVKPGEILALIGPNGAGKSTLIRAVAGILPLDSGKILVAGKDLSQMTSDQRSRYLAVVPQARHLPPAFTVYETTLLGRTPYMGWLGSAKNSDHTAVQLALERTQAMDLAERRVGELSGGEQQRVLLARALAQETPVLLLDEPTTHLDLSYQTHLLNLLRLLASQRQLAVLMALHDLNAAAGYADRLALLVDGRLQAVGRSKDVLTPQILSKVYKVPVEVMEHPLHGTPVVMTNGFEEYPTSESSARFEKI